jgi:hypothetical protein
MLTQLDAVGDLTPLEGGWQLTDEKRLTSDLPRRRTALWTRAVLGDMLSCASRLPRRLVPEVGDGVRPMRCNSFPP